MKRIFLFLMTNVAVLAVISVVFFALSAFFGVNTSGYNQQGQLDYISLLVISAVIGFAGSLVSLAMSKSMAKRSMNVQLIEQPKNSREAWLVQTVQRQARQAGIDMPEVGIFPSPAPNAFATGARKNSALVAVSEGLLQNMTQDEVEAVLGHEVAHVANGDMVTLTLVQGVVNTFVVFLSRIAAHVVDQALFRRGSHGNDRDSERGYRPGPGYYVTYMLAQVVLGFLASAIVCWFSRQREFRADIGGAELAGRNKMIAALQRLQGAQPAQMPEQMAAFGINMSAASGMRKLFMTHPPLEVRIAALQQGR